MLPAAPRTTSGSALTRTTGFVQGRLAPEVGNAFADSDLPIALILASFLSVLMLHTASNEIPVHSDVSALRSREARTLIPAHRATVRSLPQSYASLPSEQGFEPDSAPGAHLVCQRARARAPADANGPEDLRLDRLGG